MATFKTRFKMWKYEYFIKRPNYFTRNKSWSRLHWRGNSLEHKLWRIYYKLRGRNG